MLIFRGVCHWFLFLSIEQISTAAIHRAIWNFSGGQLLYSSRHSSTACRGGSIAGFGTDFLSPPQTYRGILLLQRNWLRYGSFHDFVDDLVPTWERFSMSLQFSYNFDDVFGWFSYNFPWFSYNFPWFSNNFDDVFMIQHFPACLSTNCQTSSRPQLAALNSPRWITIRGIGFPPHGSNLTLAKATWHSIYQVVAVSNIFVIFTPKIGEDERIWRA